MLNKKNRKLLIFELRNERIDDKDIGVWLCGSGKEESLFLRNFFVFLLEDFFFVIRIFIYLINIFRGIIEWGL